MVYTIISDKIIRFRGRECEALLEADILFRSVDRVEVWYQGECVLVFVR